MLSELSLVAEHMQGINSIELGFEAVSLIQKKFYTDYVAVCSILSKRMDQNQQSPRPKDGTILAAL